MFIYQCHCGKDFNSSTALRGHSRIHSEKKPASPFISKVCVLDTREEIASKNLEKYLSLVSTCVCGVKFKSGHSRTKFCSHACSASHTNKTRTIKTGSTKEFKCTWCAAVVVRSNRCNPDKVTCDNCKHNSKATKIKNPSNTRTCSHCNEKFESPSRRKYCPDHRDLYSESAKGGFKFTFNVFDYPDLFDLEQVQRIGFFCPGGRFTKNGETNPNGLSRDHKVSVNESIRNSYDPFYITHPLNCAIMPHIENNKKKTSSSITYDALKKAVDSYNSRIK